MEGIDKDRPIFSQNRDNEKICLAEETQQAISVLKQCTLVRRENAKAEFPPAQLQAFCQLLERSRASHRRR